MPRLIDGDALYEKACDLEAQALDYIAKISSKTENWIMWNAILAERLAFKHDVYDAPTIEPTLYGYNIKHLAFVARVMEEEGVTAEYAVRTFDDISRILKMIIDEAREKILAEVVKKED